MNLRLYIANVIGDGLTTDTAFRTTLQAACQIGFMPQIDVDVNGKPVRNWLLCVAKNQDWTAQDADATLFKLFDTADLPDTITTWADLKAFLQSKVVGDIPAARRQTLNNKLISLGIDTSQITLQTTWWAVLRGIVKFINGGVLPTADGIGI